MKILKDLFLDELADMYDAEQRLVRSLPGMAEAASSPELTRAFQVHLDETRGHVVKLQGVFSSMAMEPRGRPSEAIAGLLRETDELIFDYDGSPAMDAALIAATQKIEHYEIATYGCLHAWAILLKEIPAASLLHQIMDQEKVTNELLTILAVTKLNEKAVRDDS